MQNIVKKYYNGKNRGKGVLIFGAVSVVFACTFFVFLSGFDLNFKRELIPYSLLFALFYGMATVTAVISIKLGPLALTSLISSYSLTIPTVYGLFYCQESPGVFLIIGFCLLLTSLFLINAKASSVKITLGWAISVAFYFIGNGLCTVVQNLQQREFGGKYKNEFMIIALVCVAILLFAVAIFSEKKTALESVKRGGYLMALNGIFNGSVNLFVMLLATRMDASVMYPIMSGGGIILTWTVSRFLYKEKLSKKQNVALILGISSIVCMNINI